MGPPPVGVDVVDLDGQLCTAAWLSFQSEAFAKDIAAPTPFAVPLILTVTVQLEKVQSMKLTALVPWHCVVGVLPSCPDLFAIPGTWEWGKIPVNVPNSAGVPLALALQELLQGPGPVEPTGAEYTQVPSTVAVKVC
jgi:hypothetical protein